MAENDGSGNGPGDGRKKKAGADSVPVMRRRGRKKGRAQDRASRSGGPPKGRAADGGDRPPRRGPPRRGPPRGRGGGSSRRGSAGGASRARIAAANALVKVDHGAHVEDILGRARLEDPRDRGHAWFLALGTLRHRASVDAALRPHLNRPLGGLDPEVRAVLRLGAFEKLHGRAADHAVVNEAVEVVKGIGGGRAAGLVNAVLRRVRPVPLSDDEKLEHPAWILARWRERYGEAATAAWATANNVPAPLSLVAKGEAEALRARLVEAGLEVAPVTLGGQTLDGVWRLETTEGPVTDLPGFDEGAFWVQDPAAVAVADLVGARAGERVLDACAAPGGKSFRLLSRGAKVTAVDAQGGRLQRLREGLTRLGLEAEIRHHDWTQGPLPEAGGPFDAVLVDAPCTGLGTLRRHPEIRWRRQLMDLLALPRTQLEILTGAASHVADGGRLVYAVCSPEPEEGRGVVDAFLQSHEGFTLERELSMAPPEADEDAHYGAVLRRG